MCVAGVDGTEVTGRMVAVQVVLGPDGIEGMLRPSTFPEVGALRGGDDPEPTWCSRRWLHPLILSETGPPEAVRAGGRAGVVTSSCRRAGFASHRLPSGSRRAGPSRGRARLLGLRQRLNLYVMSAEPSRNRPTRLPDLPVWDVQRPPSAW